jgi:hypothetical protein
MVLRFSSALAATIPLIVAGCDDVEGTASDAADSSQQVDDACAADCVDRSAAESATHCAVGTCTEESRTEADADRQIEDGGRTVSMERPPIDAGPPLDASVTGAEAGFAIDASPSDAPSTDAILPEAAASSCEASATGCVSPCDDAQACSMPALVAMCADGKVDLQRHCREGSERAFSHADTIAQPFTPTEDVRVGRFGVHAGPGSCFVYQSLHTDANGEPGRILNWVNYRPVQANSDNLDVPISALDRHTKLAGGVRYWLVLRLGVVEACSFFVADAGSEVAYRIGHSTDIFAPDDMLPGETAPGPGGRIAQFIEVQR